mmetsp:Transcript_60930/g.154809  ORF Transcript_60930/g.154809 Transcript_60930/m.154809 type:complete len:356 (-) Transcript_60930:183-1250(-)
MCAPAAAVVQAVVAPPTPAHAAAHMPGGFGGAFAGYAAAAAMSPAASQWRPGGGAPFHLLCTAANGRDPASLMGEPVRAIDVPATRPMAVGRQHQPGFFEAMLGQESRYLTCISRSHFELEPLGVAANGSISFRLRNNSGSPIRTSQGMLSKGEQAVLSLPSSIDFLGTSYAGEVPVLVATLLLEDCPPLSPELWPGAAVAMPMQWGPHRPTVPSGCTLVCAFSQCCDVTTLAPEARRAPLAGGGDVAEVGRKHQPGFFEGLLGSDPDRLRFISRSHFSLRAIGDFPGTFALTNHSCNAVRADDFKVGTGDSRQVGPGSVIDFVAEVLPPAAGQEELFLRLRLEVPGCGGPYGGH